MKCFTRVSRLTVFVMSVKTGTAAIATSFLPNTSTAWYWQSCKHLSLPYWGATKMILQQSSLTIRGSISMEVKSGGDGTVRLQPQVMYGVRRPLGNFIVFIDV
jgi:hypothetical protein